MFSARPAQSGPSVKLETLSSGESLDAEVSAVLAEFPAVVGLQRVAFVTAHGGLSGTRLWHVETVETAYALRKWPAEHPSPEQLRFIHAVLAHACNYGMSILPVPVAASGGETFVTRNGRLWELAPWLPGETSFVREPTQAKIDSAMSTLAKFHLAAAEFPSAPSFGKTRLRGPSPGLIERFRRFDELDANRLKSLRRAVAESPIGASHDVLAKEMLADLPNAVTQARPLLAPATTLDLSLQPCVRDIWHGNMLFTGNEVTGIVDFGAMQVDSPALDVARLLGSMAGDDAGAWRRGMAAYEPLRPLSGDEITAVRAADASGTVLGCVNWLRWLYVQKRQFSDLQAVEMRMNSLAVRLRRLARPYNGSHWIGFADPSEVR